MNQVHAALAVVAAGAFFASHAWASDALVQFDRGFGVDPVAGIAAGAPVPNIVLSVPPGGRPWVIRSLRAGVLTDGGISVKGAGLLLAGGDAIGTRGPVSQVFATLFCAGVAFHSPASPLDAHGNFVIKGRLGEVPPNPCVAPVLLIRNVGGTAPWFAAGIVASDDD